LIIRAYLRANRRIVRYIWLTKVCSLVFPLYCCYMSLFSKLADREAQITRVLCTADVFSGGNDVKVLVQCRPAECGNVCGPETHGQLSSRIRSTSMLSNVQRVSSFSLMTFNCALSKSHCSLQLVTRRTHLFTRRKMHLHNS